MTGSVANSIRRARAPSSLPPSGNALNKLNLALDEILLSSSAIANGTSTVLDSAASATPSANGSLTESATLSESTASPAESSPASESILFSNVASVLSESAVSAVTPSATRIASVSASQRATSAPASGTPAASPPSGSASSSELALNVPKNAAVSSASSSAAPASSSAASATKSDTLKTNDTSSTASSSSSSARPTSSSTSSSTDTPKTSSSAPSKASATEAPASSKASSSSAPSIVISTQRAQTSTSTSSSTDIQMTVSGTSSTAGQQLTTANSAASPQPSESSSSSAVQGQNSPTNANSRDSQPSAAASPSADGTDNLVIGATSSSSVHADTTLSTAKAITITSGSSTFTTTPAFITSISVSSGTDGSAPQTFSSIFANPTTVSKSTDLSDWTFWDKRGAVAGVFTVVAIASLSFIFGVFYCWRRRRQRMAHGPAAVSQFRRFSGPPDMSQHPTTYQAVRGLNIAPPSYRDDPQRHLMAPSITSGLSNGHEDPALTQRSGSQASHSTDVLTGALGLTGVLANSSGNMQSYNGPFSDYHRYISTGDTRLSTPPGEPVGIAFSSDFAMEAKPAHEAEKAAEGRSPSPAPSSPSIYPPSLPPVPEKDEDDYLFYERETKHRPESRFLSPPPKAVINDSDSRNPFASPLDFTHDAALKQNVPPARVLTGQAYRPLTPPDSSPGHSALPSPTTPQFPGTDGTTMPLNPFSNAFLGRSVSARIVPLPRPKRNPLRLSASGSGSSLKDGEIL